MTIPNLDPFVKSKTVIKFITKRISDPTEWSGIVLAASVDYSIAEQFTDVQTYHNAVRQVDPTLDEDYKRMTYFILKINNEDKSVNEQSKLYAFAVEWINEATFKQCSNFTKYEITLYLDEATSVDQVINILRSSNINCFKSVDDQKK